jgi:perosamine synthetase
MLGSIGHIGCFSFEAKKNMTTGDGGMLTLNNDKQYETFKRLRWLGINKDTWKRFSSKTGSYSWYYEISELGFKYNMNDIAAAIGLVQLKKLPGMISKKDKLIAKYNKELSKIPEVKIPVKRDWGKFAYWLYIIQTDKRDELIDYLQQQGITTGVHSMPTQLHPLYANLKAKTPVADEVWKKIVTLPLYPSMTPAEQNRVIRSIQKFFKSK